MSAIPKSGFGLVIKTNEYTGNFEREICAFLTGQTGECGVGDDLIDVLSEGRPDFDGNIDQVADDNGCHRPVSLDESNGNNLIIFFHSKPTEEQINWIKTNASKFDEIRRTHGRMAEFYKDAKKIEILGFALEVYEHTSNRTEL